MNIARLFSFAAAIPLVSGCAVLDPYQIGSTAKFDELASLEHAVSFAEDTRRGYLSAISQHSFAERTVGFLLTGAATGASFLGVRGGRTGQISALAASGSGLFGVGSILLQRPRLGAYMAGARAVGCILDAYAPAIAASDLNFETRFNAIKTEVGNLRNTLQTSGQISGNARSAANNAIALAEGLFATHGRTMAQFRLSGRRLYEDVHAIHSNVATALLDTEPDLKALVTSLDGLLSTGSGLIVPRTEDTPAVANAQAVGHQISALSQEDRTVIDRARALQSMIEAFSRDALILNELPDDPAVDECADFTEVRPLTVMPQPMLTAKKGQKGEIQVRGGRKPYTSSFVGEAPADDKALKVTQKESGKGFDVTTDAGAATKIYTLAIEDAQGRTVSLIVSVEP